VATGTPVVLVVVSGRPLAIEWAAEHCAAVLLAWVPGDAGPDAITDVLLGAHNPGGKLPISFPRHVGQVPLSYRHHPSGGRSNWKGDYVDGPATPLWPFGFGRSYSAFEVSNLRLDRTDIATAGGEVVVRVDVENCGRRAGDEVIQLYCRDEEASVARPVLELCAFRRVPLASGERRTVAFRLAAEQFAYTGVADRRIIEPGRVGLFAGTSSADLPLRASLDLIGPTIDLPERNRYFTDAQVE
jgi:beta-xylosidase